MSNLKLAEKLLIKAEQDLKVVSKWRSDPDIAEEIIGFHAQQSAEKMLKAVLTYKEVEYPFTHRLADLIDLIRDNDLPFSEQLEEIRYLTPFAVEFRYQVYEEEQESADFDEIYSQLLELWEWGKGIIYEGTEDA